MGKHNMKTQKGIKAHAAEAGEFIDRGDIDTAEAGMEATIHINGDAHPTSVKLVMRDSDGLVKNVTVAGGAVFTPKVSPNCLWKAADDGRRHEVFLESGSFWLELGVAYTKHDPHF